MSRHRRAWVAAAAAAAARLWALPGRAHAAAPAAGGPGEAHDPPPEPREFRAAWVATVGHIDWPSRPGLAPAAQRAEALAILERARAIGLNAIVLQVRPAGDALYPSALEPWSEFLTGAQGRPPRPYWDPLAFWLREAHRRGLELHAWLNPYRARHSLARTPFARPHLALRVPEAVKRYGDQWWMDPSHPAAQAHTLAVAEDLLRRYDVDGLHIDDYFYPYPLQQDGAELAFPDSEAYLHHLGRGGTLTLPAWRRSQVDALVQALYRGVRRLRPQARFGISPFGLGRPDRRPPGVTGFSQYDKLYADVERWLEEGWLDYLAPQLYWPMAEEGRPFGLLLQHWVQANVQRRHLWPGLFASAVRGPGAAAAGANGGTPAKAWPAREVLDQIAALARSGAAGGHIHFSMVALLQDRDGLATQLRAGPYAQPALAPATPWLADRPAPPAPALQRAAQAVHVAAPAGWPAPARWAVWRRRGAAWRFAVHGPLERIIARQGADAVVVSAVDRLGQVGARSAVHWP